MKNLIELENELFKLEGVKAQISCLLLATSLDCPNDLTNEEINLCVSCIYQSFDSILKELRSTNDLLCKSMKLGI